MWRHGQGLVCVWIRCLWGDGTQGGISKVTKQYRKLLLSMCMASGDGINSAVRFSCAEINRPATSESSKRSTQIHQQWRFRSNLPYRSRSDLKSQPVLWCVYGNKGFFSIPPRSISLQGAFGNETAGAWFYCHMLCLALMKDKSSLNYSIT